MPSLGADMEAGTLVEWVRHAGDAVKRGDIIAVVDTQKGAIEIEGNLLVPAPVPRGRSEIGPELAHSVTRAPQSSARRVGPRIA